MISCGHKEKQGLGSSLHGALGGVNIDHVYEKDKWWKVSGSASLHLVKKWESVYYFTKLFKALLGAACFLKIVSIVVKIEMGNVGTL